MTTSGTYSFLLSRDDLIGAALRLVGAYGPGDTIPAQDITDCAQALNIIAKEMAIDGLPLWCVQDVAVPLVVNQGTYNLSTITNSTLPLKILDAYLVDQTGNSTQLTLTSRYDWDRLGSKQAASIPNQLFYDPQLGAGVVTLYQVPALTGYTLHVVLQRQIQDFNLATDNPDFPQEAYRLLKWALADEIGLEYRTDPVTRKEINARAAVYREKFMNSQQEYASVTFAPSAREQNT